MLPAGPWGGLLQVAVAEADAGSSDPLPDPPRPGPEVRRPSHGPAARLGLERIRTNLAQPSSEGRGVSAGWGLSPSRVGARGICGPGRTGCAATAGSSAGEAEAEGARRCSGSLFCQREDPQSEGQGVVVARSVGKKT